MKPAHKVLLVILDGWGIRKEREGNAILLAGTPNLDRIRKDMPFTELQTSGLAVGLPEGQMGNSEVGHTNIGAGRIVYQDLVRINRDAEAGALGENPILRAAMDQAKKDGRAFHLLGLVSPGGVHSHTDHLYALLRAAKARGLSKVYVHAFLDGRDTPPQSALGYVESLEQVMQGDGREDRHRERPLLRDGPRQAVGPGEAGVRRPRPLRGAARALGGGGDLRGVRREGHRRVRAPDGDHRRERRAGGAAPRWRRGAVLQLPRRPRPGDHLGARVPGLQGVRPRRPASSAATSA